MALLKELFSNTALYVKCFVVKNVYKLLYQCCGILAKCKFLDLIVAHWLYTNDCERNFSDMVRFIIHQLCKIIWKKTGLVI